MYQFITSDLIVSILDREPLPLSRHLPDVPAELQRIVSKALRKDKEERYQVYLGLNIATACGSVSLGLVRQ